MLEFLKFVLPDEPFAKAFWILETFVLVTIDLCVKLASSLESPIKCSTITKTSALFFIPSFKLLSWKLDNFAFKVLYIVSLYWCYIKAKQIVEHIHNTPTVPSEKFKIVLFAFSIAKNIVALPAGSRFPVKWINI